MNHAKFDVDRLAAKIYTGLTTMSFERLKTARSADLHGEPQDRRTLNIRFPLLNFSMYPEPIQAASWGNALLRTIYL
jgi:hypothetical protein